MKRILLLLLALSLFLCGCQSMGEAKAQQIHDNISSFQIDEMESNLMSVLPGGDNPFVVTEYDRFNVFSNRCRNSVASVNIWGTTNKTGNVTYLQIKNFGFDPAGMFSEKRILSAFDVETKSEDYAAVCVILEMSRLIGIIDSSFDDDSFNSLFDEFTTGNTTVSRDLEDWIITCKIDNVSSEVIIEAICKSTLEIEPAIFDKYKETAKDQFTIDEDVDRYKLLEEYIMDVGRYSADEDLWYIEVPVAGNVYHYLELKEGKFSFWKCAFYKTNNKDFSYSYRCNLNTEDYSSFIFEYHDLEKSSYEGAYVIGEINSATGAIISLSDDKCYNVSSDKVHKEITESQLECKDFVDSLLIRADLDKSFEKLFK